MSFEKAKKKLRTLPKDKTKETAQKAAAQRKKIGEAKEALALVVTARLEKSGLSEEEKRISVNSAACFEGDTKGSKQCKVDLTVSGAAGCTSGRCRKEKMHENARICAGHSVFCLFRSRR